MSTDHYLAYDLASEVKNEFWDGTIVTLNGAPPTHNLICAAIGGELRQRIKVRDGRVYAPRQRVRIHEECYVYPDFAATCGKAEFTDENPASLINPTMVVEVSSPSTERRDRCEKLEAYTSLPSLQVYWIVETDRAMVTCYERQSGIWTLRVVSGVDEAATSSLFDGTLPLTEIYDQAEWPADELPTPKEDA
ncbi:MAG: Uma2 family endonuclease [Bacteroidota bacterium]